MSTPRLVPYDAVILAGGAGSRLGGVDKACLELAGQPLLARAVKAAADARAVVVVGPRREMPLPRDVTWAREDPPGCGPVAAVLAGVQYCTADVIVVLGVDTPLVDRLLLADLVARLAAGSGAANSGGANSGAANSGAANSGAANSGAGRSDSVDAVMLVDGQGRRQPLLAAYRRQALLAAPTPDAEPASDVELALHTEPAPHVEPAPHAARRPRSMRDLLRALSVAEIPDLADASRDADTWPDVAYLQNRLG